MSAANHLALKILFSALVVAGAVAAAACEGGGEAPVGPKEPVAVVENVPGGSPARGQQAIQRYGCGACHRIPGVSGANGSVGPPLTDFAHRDYIAGQVQNTPANLILWIQNPQAIEPGTAMPPLGVTEDDARDIAAYLYTR